MARPKKSTGLPDEQMVTIPFKEYLDTQNRLEAAGAQLGSVRAGMLQVQTFTKSALEASGLSLNDTKATMEDFPALAELLQKDVHTMGTPLADPFASIPLFGPLAKAKEKKPKKEKKPRDPNAPVRPVTAYFLYLAENRDRIREKLGQDAKAGDVQKEGTAEWNALTEAQQEVYKSQYRDNFQDYQKKMKEYQANGGRVSSVDLEPAEDAVEDAHPGAGGIIAQTETEEEESDESSDDSEDDAEYITPSPPPPPPARSPIKSAKDVKKSSQKTSSSASALPLREHGHHNAIKEKSPEKKKRKLGKEDAPEEVTNARMEREDSVEITKKKKRSGDDKKKRKSYGNDY